MKDYKTIDFIKSYKTNKKSGKSLCIIILLILVSVFCKLTMNQDRNIKGHSKDESLRENTEISENHEERVYLNFDNIKAVCNLIGKENINRMLVENSSIEIEGQCSNLDILEQLRNESNLSYFSINSLVRYNDKYIFNLKYNIGE